MEQSDQINAQCGASTLSSVHLSGTLRGGTPRDGTPRGGGLRCSEAEIPLLSFRSCDIGSMS